MDNTTKNKCQFYYFVKLSCVSFSRTMNINLKSIINVSQVVVKKMIDNKTQGAIVNVSSQASKVIFVLI